MHSGAPSSFDPDLQPRPVAARTEIPRVLSAAYRTGRPGEKGSPHRSGPQPQISAFRPHLPMLLSNTYPLSSRRRKRVTIKVVSRPQRAMVDFASAIGIVARDSFDSVVLLADPFTRKAFQPGGLVGINRRGILPRDTPGASHRGHYHERPLSAPGNGGTGACYELSPSNSCACLRRGAIGECIRLHGCTGVSARAHPAVRRVPFPSVSEERGKGRHPCQPRHQSPKARGCGDTESRHILSATDTVPDAVRRRSKPLVFLEQVVPFSADRRGLRSRSWNAASSILLPDTEQPPEGDAVNPSA